MKNLLSIVLVVGLSLGLSAQTQIPVGPQSSQFTSMVRGYHFTSPTNFTICQLYIPPDAAGAAGQPQHIRVVRFNAAAPPAFPVQQMLLLNYLQLRAQRLQQLWLVIFLLLQAIL